MKSILLKDGLIINGLGTNSGATLIATLRKIKVREKVKEKQRANFEDSEDPSIVPKIFWSHVKFSSYSTRIPEIVSYGKRIRNNASDQAELFNEFFLTNFLLLVIMTLFLSL